MPRVRFQPLRINKRSWRYSWLPSSRPQQLDLPDAETPPYNDDDDYETEDYSSRGSSRASSGSYGSEEAMLKEKRAVQTPASAYSELRKTKRKCNRYFTIILGSVLVILVLALTQMHYSSTRDVALGIHKLSPKPPLWEEFPILHRYYGGIRSLVPFPDNKPEYPRSQAETAEEVMKALQNVTEKTSRDSLPPADLGDHGDATQTRRCQLNKTSNILVPSLVSHSGIVNGFPGHVIGMALDGAQPDGSCFDRFGRLGPYGLGYSRRNGGTGGGLEGDLEGLDSVWSNQPQVDFRSVDWAEAQDTCAASFEDAQSMRQSRSVILVRTSSEHVYDAEELLSLRSLVTETALWSGARISVHFLVEIPEHSAGVWSDKGAYQQVLDSSVPAEFRAMASLWSVDQMHLVYGDLAYAYRGDSVGHSEDLLPVQHFATAHPEYDHFWNWDMAVRSTGHVGKLLNASSEWARQQPRKELWNRNDRFYVPSEHGSWDDFRHMVRVQSEHGSSNTASIWSKAAIRPADAESGAVATVSKPIWGPFGPVDDAVEVPEEGKPQSQQDQDKYEWGVEEEADLVSFSPIFDPDGTLWHAAERLTGYNLTRGHPPRRASVGGAVRLSRRLLLTMHHESAIKRRYMDPWMWPASIALHHGYKAVSVPQANYVDRKWPTDYLAAIFNSGLNGAAGGARTSVFDDSRQHNLKGLSWSPNSQFASKLWKRWLGYRVDGEGGEEHETVEGSEGRMCLPPMLLWPVQGIELVVQ